MFDCTVETRFGGMEDWSRVKIDWAEKPAFEVGTAIVEEVDSSLSESPSSGLSS